MHRKLQAVFGAAVSLAVLTAAGPTLADRITGTPEDDLLPGTPRRDTIRGLAGNDTITPGRGDDRAFGDEGDDTFRWAQGDGRDRFEGGPDLGTDDRLEIRAGGRLRLHLDAPGAGPLARPRDDLEVIGVRGIEGIVITGTGGADRFVISSDESVPGLDLISTGAGRDLIDARGVRVRVGEIGAGTGIGGGRGDDVVRVGGAGASVGGGPGDDEVHLGAGRDGVALFASDGHDTVIGFGEGDVIELFEDFRSCTPGPLDTNGDGRLTARDATVTVEDGALTLDLSAGFAQAPGTVTVTLVGRTRLGLGSFSVTNENC